VTQTPSWYFNINLSQDASAILYIIKQYAGMPALQLVVNKLHLEDDQQENAPSIHQKNPKRNYLP
jgi:hypothetical protein